MKKVISVLLIICLAVSCFALSACGDNSKENVIKIGATSTPHAEILAQVKKALKDKGYELDVVIYNDYVMPNKALNDGELDANYFQHAPYMNSFNEANNTTLVSAAAIHYEPFGLFGNGVSKISDIAVGTTIIIPADDSNETRALLLLAQEGLITLPENASAINGVTVLDIVDNKGYNIKPVDADTVPAQLNNSDKGTVAVINGNYALAAGLKIADALATESVEGDAAKTYANIIAVKSGNENSAKIKALVEALETEEVKNYIDSTYNGAVKAMF